MNLVDWSGPGPAEAVPGGAVGKDGPLAGEADVPTPG